MKEKLKKMMLGIGLMLAGMVGAANTGTLVTFSTTGPDAYPDGAAVVDGEYYALAWASDAAKLVMGADGTVVEGRVLAKVSVAEGGRCPPVNVKLDDETASACKDGAWGVFLLDTRGSAAGAPVIRSATRIENATVEIASNGFLSYTKIGPRLLGAPAITDGITDNPEAAIGSTGYATLKDAIDAAQAGDTVTLMKDVDMRAYFSATSTRFPISRSITIDGQDHTITVGGRGFGVGMNATSNIDVTFKDVTVANSGSDARCIDTRGNLNSLTLDHVTLDTNGASGTTQPLTIGGNQSSTATVVIKNGSKIQTNDDGTAYYAIITFNPVNMTITDSTIKGWACIYAKGKVSSAGSAGSVFTITDSELVSKSVYSGTSNAFSMLQVEDNNVTFNITNTKIDINATGDQPQAIVGTSGLQTDVTANLGEGNEVTLSGKATFKNNTGNPVVSGGTFNVEVPEEVCADGMIPATLDEATGKYGVKTGTYVAQVVRGGEVIAKYESFDAVLEVAQNGDTVQLLADVTGVTTTYNIDKTLTIYGQGQYKIVAGENTTPRSVVSAWDGSRVMFDMTRSTANVTFKDITIDNGEGHYYSFLARVKSGTTTFENAAILHGAEADAGGADGVGYGAAVQVDGGTVLVNGDFYADTHGAPLAEGAQGDRAKGIFPFTAFLYQDGGIHFDDGVNASIGQDLLLVGMVGALDVASDTDRQMVQEKLDAMNVPDGYYPYTLKVGDNSLTSFTGASPLGWNDIIDYGKEIMTATSSLGMEMDPATTPVEVGLLSNTELPDTFKFEDSNFTVNGNGYALSGTIKYTDTAGLVENIVLGTNEKPLTLDMTDVTEPVEIGSDVTIGSVTVKMTPEQAAAGTPVIIWDAEGGIDAPANESGVTVALVDVQGEPTGETASLIWDDELGIAYIGPCEARLTGPTHDAPIYTTLARAIELAANSGDTVTLLMDIVNFTGTQDVNKSLVLDGAGYKITADPSTSSSGAMFDVRGEQVTFKNLTIDGGHRYWYCVQAHSGNLALQDMTILNGAQRMVADDAENPQIGYGSAVHVNGATLTVSGEFNATGGGKAAGVFPFTAILYSNGMIHFDNGVDADIGDDLLLVGLGPVNIDAFMGQYDIEDILGAMNIPAGYIPYTLALDGSNSGMGFVGASPQSWNTIIDYGREIMEVATESGLGGFNMDPDTTPVEVGLLTDTELPDTFTYKDANFSVNGNGNALSGTIIFKDEAEGGMLRDIELGAEGKPLVLDLSQTTKAVDLGAGVTITEIIVKMTEEQARVGTAVFDWNAEEVTGEDLPQHGTVAVTVVDAQGDATGETKGLVWDEEYGVAYIGPVEARLSGPTHETPIYTTLADALARAESGDTVKLLKDATLAQVQNVGVNATLDLAGWTVEVTGDAGIIVANATLGITNTVANAADAITGTIKAGTGATPTSLVKSGEGGLVRIPMGIFAATEGQKALETADTGKFEVSGGYFSVAVLSEYCATGYAPADAETGAPQPYTVAEAVLEFVYPIEGTGGVPITDKVWLAAQFPSIYPDAAKPIYASITNALVEALSENGANGMPKWESYVLGFNPADPAAKLRLTATAKDAATVTVSGIIDLAKFPEPTGTTVKFRLAKRNGNKWTNLAIDSATPSFDCRLDDVAGEELAIFADIVTE